jgi:hypothetical protein
MIAILQIAAAILLAKFAMWAGQIIFVAVLRTVNEKRNQINK